MLPGVLELKLGKQSPTRSSFSAVPSGHATGPLWTSVSSSEWHFLPGVSHGVTRPITSDGSEANNAVGLEECFFVTLLCLQAVASQHSGGHTVGTQCLLNKWACEHTQPNTLLLMQIWLSERPEEHDVQGVPTAEYWLI